MNPRALGLGFSLVIVGLCPAQGQGTNTAREYREATTSHEKALAAENKHYQDTLNVLIRHARDEGDADTLARLKAALAALPIQPPAAATPGVEATKPNFLGPWQLTYTAKHGSTRHFVADIRADGTWSYEGTLHGTWSVADDCLALRFDDHPDYLDRYNLPVENGELHGSNVHGEKLVLRRPPAPPPAGESPSSYFGAGR